MEELLHLSRRERQIMDVVYARGAASASDVLAGLPDPPTRVSVRTLLRILEAKGHLRHRRRGREYIYLPTRPRAKAARSALGRVLKVFFSGSMERALASHLADPRAEVSEAELRRLEATIRRARKEGK